MAKGKYKDKSLEAIHGDLHGLIPTMVNKYGQVYTAQSLGVSQYFISDWLRRNGYLRVIQYVRMDSAS